MVYGTYNYKSLGLKRKQQTSPGAATLSNNKRLTLNPEHSGIHQSNLSQNRWLLTHEHVYGLMFAYATNWAPKR